LSPASLINLTITQQVIAAVVVVTVAIALIAVACLPPSSPLPWFASLLKHPPPPPTLSFGWLLHFLNDVQPPKVWALPISLFLDGSRFGTPSKGISHVNRKTATGRLQKTHGELWHHDLGPWWMLPWQYGAKMLGVGWRRLILFVVWEPKTPQNFLPASKCYSHM
jgi:hypothetical protein